MSPELCSVDKANKYWLSRQRPLSDLKTILRYFRLIMYSHSSANPGNLAKIGPVDVEIIGLTETVKI